MQRYIEAKIINENKDLTIKGKEFKQKELFPSINNVWKDTTGHGRNIIEEANQVKHQNKQKMLEEPLNNYFYQPSHKETYDPSLVWRNPISMDHPSFTVNL